jgi:HK97 family phage major capsid protein
MEISQAIEQLNREWNEFKATLNGRAADEERTYGAMLGDTKAKLDAIGARLDELEVKLQRPKVRLDRDSDRGVKDLAKTAAFQKFLRKGHEALTPDELKLLVVSDDTRGGFGATEEFDAEIIKGVVDISPVRSFVRVRTTGQRSVGVMKRTGTFAARWVAETGKRTETKGLTYGLEEIPTHEIYAIVDVSIQDFEDTSFDLEGELRMEFSEQFAVAEGQAVINGDANGKPEGIMKNAAIKEDKTGDATKLTYDGFVDVAHNGKAGYLPLARYIFNLKTLGKSRLIKDNNGNPLWVPMAQDTPSTINGFPYTIVPDMPDVDAGAYPVAFGAFQRGYTLADRIQLQISRDPFTQAENGAVRFIARKRLGGQVVVAEAIRKLKVAA